MKKIFMLIIMLYLISNYLDSATRRFRASYQTDPSTTISIGWDQFSGNSPVMYYGTVDKGTNSSQYPSQCTPVYSNSDGGMKNTFIHLSGLIPNTIYYFVIKDSEGTSQRYSFQTISNDPTQPISLICGADTRSGRDVRNIGNRLVAKLRPQAVIFDGDLTDNGIASELQDWFDDWTNSIASDGRITPIVMAEGNHEVGVVNLSNLYDTPNDGNDEQNNYHSLPFGGTLLRIYSLNSFVCCLSSETSWLQGQLRSYGNSTTWNMPQYHLPVRPVAGVKSNNQAQYDQWVSLFEQYNVKLVQEADAHVFSMTWPIKRSSASGNDQGFIRDDVNGIVYFGEGGWGAPLYAADNPKAWTRGYESINEFMLVHFYPDRVNIYTVRLENDANVPILTDQNRLTVPSQLSLETMKDRNCVLSGNFVTITKVVSQTATINPTDVIFSIYPTTVINNLNVKIDKVDEGTKVRISDLTGRIIADVPMNVSGLLQLNMEKYASGVYVVDIHNLKSLKTVKIIKQ